MKKPKWSKVDPQTLKKIQMSIKQGRIEPAPSKKVSELHPWVQKILKVLGFPEAFVTDESIVGDFISPFDSDRQRTKDLELLRRRLDFPRIALSTFIYDIARRISEENRSLKRQLIDDLSFKAVLVRSDREKVLSYCISMHDKPKSPEKLKKAYGSIYDQMICLVPERNTTYSLNVDKKGLVDGAKKGSNDRYAMEFTRWEELLGMKVTSPLGLDKSVACLLFEATFIGWKQKDIQSEILKIKRQVRNIKRGAKNFKSITIDEVKEKLRKKMMAKA